MIISFGLAQLLMCSHISVKSSASTCFMTILPKLCITHVPIQEVFETFVLERIKAL